jgi:hypothetical protein
MRVECELYCWHWSWRKSQPAPVPENVDWYTVTLKNVSLFRVPWLWMSIE